MQYLDPSLKPKISVTPPESPKQQDDQPEKVMFIPSKLSEDSKKPEILEQTTNELVSKIKIKSKSKRKSSSSSSSQSSSGGSYSSSSPSRRSRSRSSRSSSSVSSSSH
jgi:hypothetical protein